MDDLALFGRAHVRKLFEELSELLYGHYSLTLHVILHGLLFGLQLHCITFEYGSSIH